MPPKDSTPAGELSAIVDEIAPEHLDDLRRSGLSDETIACSVESAAVVLLLSAGRARLEAGDGDVIVHPVESDA